MGKGGLDSNDPVVNNQSEYMYQMATIVYHTLHGEQTVTLTQDQIDAAIAGERLGADGTYNGTVEAYQGQVLEAGVAYTVPVNERYWTDFSRTDVLDGPAREMAWSGTAHALVAELGVGAATHSALMLALGVFGAIGQSALTKAMQAAAALIVAPFQYTQLIWVTIAGFALFGTLPDLWTLAGAAVIIASGLYLFRSGQSERARA